MRDHISDTIVIENDMHETLTSSGRKEPGDELEQANRRLEELTAELAQTRQDWELLSYTISHDLRAHIRAVTNFAVVLEEDAGDRLAESDREHLARITRAADGMSTLVEDVLTFMSVLQSDLTLHTVDLDEVVRELAEAAPEWQSPTVDLRIAHPLGKVLGNRAGLRQCLATLLGHAAGAVAKSGHIVVRSEHADETVRLWIENNGTGIPDEQGNALRSNTGKKKGAGLGMAAVRRMAERMGGRAGVESEVDKGNRFWMEFKAAGNSAL